MFERIQRSAARFITRDYRSRYEGCLTNMLFKGSRATKPSREATPTETDLPVQGGEKAGTGNQH